MATGTNRGNAAADAGAMGEAARRAVEGLVVAESRTDMDALANFVLGIGDLKRRFDALGGEDSPRAQEAFGDFTACVSYIADALGLGDPTDAFAFEVGEEAAAGCSVKLPPLDAGEYMVCRRPGARRAAAPAAGREGEGAE